MDGNDSSFERVIAPHEFQRVLANVYTIAMEDMDLQDVSLHEDWVGRKARIFADVLSSKDAERKRQQSGFVGNG